jgi:Response regulator of the LytR/AlgR family
MIPIYLCDDDKNVLHTLSTIVKNSIAIQDYDMKLLCTTTNPLELIERVKQNNQRSIYFLDVDLRHEKYDGFTLAKQIRKLDTRGFIIFVTTHEELMFETFKYRLEAMSYLIKDDFLLEKQIRHCLDDIHNLVIAESKEVNSYYMVRVADHTYQLLVKDILYFETSTNSHHIAVHMANRRLEFRGNLTAVEKELGLSFLRIHRSFLVNSQHVACVSNTENAITLDNGTTCFLSRKGKRLLKEQGIL